MKGQLSCCDAVKGTLFSAVAVELAFGYNSAPLQGKSFRSEERRVGKECRL